MCVTIRAPIAALVPLLVVLLAGCIANDIEGPRTTYSFALWIGLLVSIAIATAFVFGWRMRRTASGSGLVRAWGMVIGSVVLGFIVFPSLLGASLELTDDGFTERSSWWVDEPTVVVFAETARIELVAEGSATNAKRRAFYLRCYDRVGAYRNVPVSLLMKQGALEPVLERAAARGVLVLSKLEG